jgi:lysophospholipase L1-like esterase
VSLFKVAFSLSFLVLGASLSWSAQASPRETVLFTGSSTIARWRSLDRDFGDFNAVNLGFSGTTFNYVLSNAGQWIRQFPDAGKVVIYSGDNDLAFGHSPETVAENANKAVLLFQKARPGLRVYVISVKPTPSRLRASLQTVKRANQLIRTALKGKRCVTFIDLESKMLKEDGSVDMANYGSLDWIHMNRRGYELWAREIHTHLRNPKEDCTTRR